MKFKKLVTLGAMFGMLTSTAAAIPMNTTVLANEIVAVSTMNTQEFRYDFDNGLGFASVTAPKTTVTGETFRAGFTYDWGDPDTVNVLQVVLTLDASVDAKITGVEGMTKTDYNLSTDGKRLSILMDAVTIKQGINALVESNKAETVALHVYMEYVNINDDGQIVENITNKDLSIQVIDGKVIEDAKTAAQTTISALPNLTDDEKSEYVASLQDLMSVDDINAVTTSAQAKDTKNLSDSKTSGVSEINTFVNNSKEENDAFITRVNNAKTINDVQTIVEEARAQDSANSLLGDIDGSGTLTVLDLAIVKTYLNSGELPTRINADRFARVADMNEDGKINVLDLSLLLLEVLNS